MHEHIVTLYIVMPTVSGYLTYHQGWSNRKKKCRIVPTRLLASKYGCRPVFPKLRLGNMDSRISGWRHSDIIH